MQKNLIAAARCNNIIYLRAQRHRLAKEEFECRDLKGNTPLWYAVVNQHVDTVSVMIFEICVDPDTECEEGNTALHKALQIDSR